jgi:hypothetical protein
MKRTLLLLPILALLGAGAAFAADDKQLDTPPAGLTPSTATVSQILKQYDAATGALKAGVDDTRREVWHFSRAGLAGTETLTRQDLNFRAKIAAGPIINEYGQILGSRWHKDANGFVSPMQGIDTTSFEMLIFMRNFTDAEDPKNDVKVVGESTDPSAYVVQITRPNYKHPEWVFYDKKSGLIDQIINVVDGQRLTATYSGYKATKGLTQPWHVHVSDGRAPLDDDFTRDSLAIGVPIDMRDFVMPGDSSTLASFSGHVDLPARAPVDEMDLQTGLGSYQKLTAPTVVVRINVNGRGLDFELATGSPESYIDWTVAQELGLPSYGQAVKTPSGDPLAYDTIIPSVQIGGLSLHNFAVRALKFNYHLGADTQVVGTLGYDVLKSGVFKIDYDNGKVTLDPAASFASDDPAPGAFMVPVLFDRGYAFLSGLLNFHPTPNILLANDFELSFIFGHFTSQYPDTVKDTTGRNHTSTFVPFADSNGYGTSIDVWLGTIADLQFGRAHYADYYVLGTNGDFDFAGHTTDAVIGADLLKYYDLYLDFPHNRVFLKPNRSYANSLNG